MHICNLIGGPGTHCVAVDRCLLSDISETIIEIEISRSIGSFCCSRQVLHQAKFFMWRQQSGRSLKRRQLTSWSFAVEGSSKTLSFARSVHFRKFSLCKFYINTRSLNLYTQHNMFIFMILIYVMLIFIIRIM